MAEGFDNDIAELLRYGTEARAEVQSIVDETAPSVDLAALAADTGYDVVLLMGQSNMQGADGAVDPLVDVTADRVWTYATSGGAAGRITQAVDPLGHLNPATSGVGPGMSFGRWYAGVILGNRRVLLVPCASSSSGFTAGNGAARWNPSAAFSTDNIANSLYERTIIAATSALSAAGANARLVGALWVQGEADINLGSDAYRGYLESLIDGLRDRLDAPDLPFVIGSMLPEFVAGTSGGVDRVHRTTPTRKPYTAFVQGPSGYLLTSDGYGVHYTAAGSRELGRRFVAGLAAAQANAHPANEVPAAPPVPPSEYVPPATPAQDGYTFTNASEVEAWGLDGGVVSVSGGALHIPVTTSYLTAVAPDRLDLTTQAVTWKLASLPPTSVNSADTYLGVTVDPRNQADSVGVTLTNGDTPWTDVRVTAGGSRIVNGGVPAAAPRTAAFYRFSASGSTVTVEHSDEAETWTTLWSGPVPWDTTAVSPFIIVGHWDGADSDSETLVDSLIFA